MAALVAALNSPPIRRLKRTWDVVSNRHIGVLDDIEKTMQVMQLAEDVVAGCSRYSHTAWKEFGRVPYYVVKSITPMCPLYRCVLVHVVLAVQLTDRGAFVQACT